MESNQENEDFECINDPEELEIFSKVLTENDRVIEFSENESIDDENEKKLSINDYEKDDNIKKNYLDNIFEIEKVFPGCLAQSIKDDLTETMKRIWPYYLGVQTSTNTMNIAGKYFTRSIFLNHYLISDKYNRGYDTRKGKFEKMVIFREKKYEQKHKNNKTLKIDFDSPLPSDKNKKKYYAFETQNTYINLDMQKTLYQDIREIYKTKEPNGNTFYHLENYQFRNLSLWGWDYLIFIKGKFDHFFGKKFPKIRNSRKPKNRS